jgi:hypothetical protein
MISLITTSLSTAKAVSDTASAQQQIKNALTLPGLAAGLKLAGTTGRLWVAHLIFLTSEYPGIRNQSRARALRSVASSVFEVNISRQLDRMQLRLSTFTDLRGIWD